MGMAQGRGRARYIKRLEGIGRSGKISDTNDKLQTGCKVFAKVQETVCLGGSS